MLLISLLFLNGRTIAPSRLRMPPIDQRVFSRWVLPAVVLILAATTAMGWYTLAGERHRAAELESRNKALSESLLRVQNQLDTVSQRLIALNETVQANQLALTAAQAPKAEPALPEISPVRRRTAGAVQRLATQPRDPRVDQLQSRLAGQERELAETRQRLETTQQELTSRIGSTRDELSGSIARTQEELEALRQRGENNYYEFDLLKNKDFQRVGPLAVSLRKADTKRRSYQIKLRVDDQEMEKKGINLFEPVFISSPDSAQPLQLVVNEISKDRIRGYIREPKHREARAAAPQQGLLVR
jgi:septal ring factor EnvC (AmiA/AmiB activator)